MAAYATPITESVLSSMGAGVSKFLTRDEVMTAREVADLLRMPTSTVYELARKGVHSGQPTRSHVAVSAAAAGAAAGELELAAEPVSAALAKSREDPGPRPHAAGAADPTPATGRSLRARTRLEGCLSLRRGEVEDDGFLD